MKANKILRHFSTKAQKSSNYDIVIVGANFGGVLSRHLKKQLQNQFNIYVVNDSVYNQRENLNILYQQGALKSENYVAKSLSNLESKQEHSDGVGIQEYIPQKNKVILTNGKEITYKQLVISSELQQDLDSIKGLKEALQDNGHPVFGSYINSSQPIDSAKKNSHYFSFKGGKSYFYIPPFPFAGEGAHYNFLAAYDTWRENQQKFLSKSIFNEMDIEFEIINANSSFSMHSKGLNDFIIQELEKRGIKYTLNAKVSEIHKDQREITVVDSSNKSSQVEYDNFYTIIPTKQDQLLVDANLSNESTNYLLNVNEKTLQHKEYKNIFGLGDICNLPTTKSFIANQSQVDVVRNNVMRNITGQYLNAFYDGYSKVPLYISKNKLTWYAHSYEDKKGFLNLFGSNGGLASKFNYYQQAYLAPVCYTLYQRGHVYGSPFRFWQKSYGELEKIPQDQLDFLRKQEQAVRSIYSVQRRTDAESEISKNQKEDNIQKNQQQQEQEERQRMEEQERIIREQQQQEEIQRNKEKAELEAKQREQAEKERKAQEEELKRQRQQQKKEQEQKEREEQEKTLQEQERQQKEQQQQKKQKKNSKTEANVEKYGNIESVTKPPKRKRGRPKKNPGDVTEYLSE
ncbi:hypothetical protein PPERSA_07647 [Pseudocohnilembus persalinus]|uniref:FAD/NAD(P)-binding domain-containing protein n=1 Tax=Pseudocohnilembus persalinus TaxID=266149 RepID=A0A0V0QIF3_PSEPJ|nr:hypothetical protein PPERSA_07647 [Pseudocohnilembus persalinus]|eukprot:KRX02002.1 hypothetical protein PPERSA_07647 [Pseudocohnilembus persalinus]